MKKKRVSEFLTEEEVKAILRVPDRRTLKGKRDYALLLLMLSTGLRKAEVCSLKIGDITTYRNQMVVDVIGKGKKQRRIALNQKNSSMLCCEDSQFQRISLFMTLRYAHLSPGHKVKAVDMLDNSINDKSKRTISSGRKPTIQKLYNLKIFNNG